MDPAIAQQLLQLERKVRQFEEQMRNQQTVELDSEDVLGREKQPEKNKQAASSKSAKKDTAAKRNSNSNSRVNEPEADRSKLPGKDNSIERIALFGEASETGTAF